MTKTGSVTVAGKALKCHHCGHGEFEVRGYYLYAMVFVGGARAAMCTQCRFVHTFQAKADLRID